MYIAAVLGFGDVTYPLDEFLSESVQLPQHSLFCGIDLCKYFVRDRCYSSTVKCSAMSGGATNREV
jgi:hypothetical protein